MPLFNPLQSTSKGLVSTVNRTFTANTESRQQKLNTNNTTIVSSTICNRGEKAIGIGFDSSVSFSQYLFILEPSGVYETPIGYNGDIYCWLEIDAAISIVEFVKRAF